MTREKYEQAKRLEERIKHISTVTEVLSVFDYQLDPPTRQSNYTIWRGSQAEITLNEAEVVCLREFLKNEKIRLEQEFKRL